MAKQNDGGPAFPQLSVESCERDGHGDLIEPFTSALGGMSLRDWFAGQAAVALLHIDAQDKGQIIWAVVAADAYALADALLAQRAEP